MQKYNKAIIAVLGGLATLLGIWGIDIPPESVSAIGTLATTVLVYVIPNKET